MPPQPGSLDLLHPASTGQPAVEVRGVEKRFGSGPPAVHDAHFTLERGRFLTILGPSGSGKTTLLRMIAGFETPSAGRITVGGRQISEVAPHRRSIGMVFQKLALFPHMTVAGNVGFALKMRRFDPASIKPRVEAMLEMVRLPGFGDRRIHQLSGGQQQRVAIARAIVTEPQVLLADEPTGNLDTQRSQEIMELIARLNDERGITVVMVTHEPDMAAFAHRIIRFVDGHIASDEQKVAA